MTTDNKIASFYQHVDSPDPESDTERILTLHTEWWAANRGADIPRMRPNFPEGPHYLMFNLQGHPYYGLDEKVQLWEHYGKQINVPEVPETRVVQFVLQGDIAWLAAEILYTLEETGDQGLAAATAGYRPSVSKHRIRSTECYRRDDGDGEPNWRMWHFHCSPLPSADEARPAFGDTARERGELVP